MKKVKVEDEYLTVTFADGKTARVPISGLAVENRERIYWANAAVTSDGLHIGIPADPFDLRVAWHVIRSLSDPDFARYMAERASEQARHIGERLRELRTKRGLTQKAVASRTKIEQANLSRIENGHFDISASTLWKILAAMGCSPGDLAQGQEAKVKGEFVAR